MSMRLPGKTVSIITLAVVISLLGLIVLQISLLKSAAAQKEQAFRQNVSAALNAVAQKLEVGEAATSALGVFYGSDVRGTDSLICNDIIAGINDSLVAGKRNPWPGDSLNPRFISVAGDTLSYSILSPQKVRIKMLPRDSGLAVTLVDTFRTPGMYRVRLPENVKIGAIECKMGSDSIEASNPEVFGRRKVAVSNGFNRIMLVKRVVSNLTESEWEPVEKRISAVAPRLSNWSQSEGGAN